MTTLVMYVWVPDFPAPRDEAPPSVSVMVERVPREGERVTFADGVSYKVRAVTQSPRGGSVVVELLQGGVVVDEGVDPYPVGAPPKVVPPEDVR